MLTYQLMSARAAPPLTLQALMLMYQLMSARAAISDRFYRALYAVLLSDGPTTSSRAPMFLALLFKVGGGGGFGATCSS